MEEITRNKKISDGLKKSWEKRRTEGKPKVKKPRFVMTNQDQLEMIILGRTGSYSHTDLAKKFSCSKWYVVHTLKDNIYTEKEIQDSLTAYKFKILQKLEKTKLKETSLRQNIVRTGLIKLSNLITFNQDIAADKLSGIVSQVQKDLWVSLGQPSEINQIQQISDELLNTLINKMENQNGNRQPIEPIIEQIPERIDNGGEGEVNISVENGEGEKTSGMEN
jgi:hypothetical protein